MKNFIFILLLLPTIAIAQNTFQPKQINLDLKGVTYRYEWAIDLRLHSNGYAIAYNTGNIRTYDKTNYMHFELGYMRNPREKSQNRNLAFSRFGQSNSFTFGKINHVFVLRAGWGRKKYLSEKARRKGLAIGYTYQIGPSLAILKPYYLQLLYPEEVEGTITTNIRNERFSEGNRDIFLDFNSVYGGGGFLKGIKEVSFTPGIQGKAATVFSLGAYDRLVKAIEGGIMFDLYPRKIAIMAETDEISNKPYFINFYINLHLGRRSN